MKMALLSGRTGWGATAAGILTALLLAIGGPASAQGLPTTGIAATKHNLGSGPGPTDRNQTNATAEICVFCHTPHGASTTAPAPLWNKRLGATTEGSYTTYATLQTPSLDGTVAPVGSISMACLSCHDGTQAMDNVINAPGSGGVLADGGGVDGRAWAWTGGTVDTTGKLGSGVALLGTNLSDDHPIGIQYCGGGLSGTGTTVNGTCADGDFVRPNTATINNNQVFWVDTGNLGTSTKERTDLPLYVRSTDALGPLVECASCHDPHVSTGQSGPNGLVAGETFLRVSNASSAVCTTCHVK